MLNTVESDSGHLVAAACKKPHSSRRTRLGDFGDPSSYCTDRVAATFFEHLNHQIIYLYLSTFVFNIWIAPLISIHLYDNMCVGTCQSIRL